MGNICYYKIVDNTIELYFQYKPKDMIISKLKRYFWKWDSHKKCWYTYLKTDSLSLAKQFGAFEASTTSCIVTNPENTERSSSVSSKTLLTLKALGCNEVEISEIDKFLYTLSGTAPKPISIPLHISSQSKCIIVVAMSTSANMIKISIVSDCEFQNTNDNIYWIERSLSKRLLHGIINNKPWFMYNNELYKIQYYSDSILMRKIKQHRDYFSNSDDLAEIWIYTLKSPCALHPKDVETVTAYVRVHSVDYSCKLNVYYCPKCGRYYINSDQYNKFASKYGLPYVKLKYDSSVQGFNYSELREESILHFIGYNVSNKDNLSVHERREKLIHVIKTETLTKAQVIYFLEFLINRNEGNLKFDNACHKWHSDLEFIRNYNLDKQQIVNAKLKN